jgi:hypothetical protein
MLTYWLIAVLLDWSSTISFHDCMVEENPIMRGAWCQYGDGGFTAVSFLLFAIVALGYMTARWYLSRPAMIAINAALFIVITIKVLTTLTNIAVVPYWVLSWIQF